MISEVARTAIRHLNRYGFERLIKYLIANDEYLCSAKVLTDIDERIIECPPDRFNQCADAFFLNYYPVSLYKEFSTNSINFSSLETMIINYLNKRDYKLWLPIDGTTIYSVSNYDSKQIGLTDEELLLFYERKLNSVLPKTVNLGIGNINTFLNASESDAGNAINLVSKFFNNLSDGLSIAVRENEVRAEYFVGGNEFPGVTSNTHSISSSVIKLVSMSNVLDEFNMLLNSDSKEQVLEDFLTENYRFLFGEKYDCIMTQLWLKFPDLDIGNSNRRLDIFMRNSVSADWELFELKKASIPLTKTVRDVPVLTSEVYNAIAQARNYKHLLLQDSVRRKFAEDGIEYYQPEIHVVIGKNPEISNEQWRRIVADEASLKILTYDNLYKSAEIRLKTFLNMLN